MSKQDMVGNESVCDSDVPSRAIGRMFEEEVLR